jgi:hypothetical protein
MNPSRSRRRWWLFAILIFAGQLAMIFSLSDHSTPLPSRGSTAPTLRLLEGPANELLALSDPTLFALPHPRSFSGRAWLSKPSIPHRSFEWTAELEWLPLPVGQLGQGFARFLDTSRDETFNTFAAPEPHLIQPELATNAVFPQKSTFRVEGPLQNRKLLTPIELKSFPHNDLLTNSVIELVVGENGVPTSWKRLPPGSGSLDADQEAMRLAGSARFESNVRYGPKRETNSPAINNLTWGRMVFSWHTLPATNTKVSP